MGRKGGRYITNDAGKRELREPPTRTSADAKDQAEAGDQADTEQNSPGGFSVPSRPGGQGGGGASSHAAAPDAAPDADADAELGPTPEKQATAPGAGNAAGGKPAKAKKG